jgi:chemotaxis protein methyltransferase CheR
MLPAPDYEFLTRFVAERAGASLGAGRQFLLQARLVPLAQTWGLKSLHELVNELRKTAESPLGDAVLDLLAGLATQFFGDPEMFADLRDQVLPELLHARRPLRQLRIWSAGTATGQEAYSLAMLLRDSYADLDSWSVEIVGTDLNHLAIQRAATGQYSQTEAQLGLPIRQLIRWFDPIDGAWRVKDELRRIVRFETADLTEPMASLGRFDVILCRNVLPGLSPSEKRTVLDTLSSALPPDGCLLLGQAESLWSQATHWTRVTGCSSAVYTPSPQSAARLRITG